MTLPEQSIREFILNHHRTKLGGVMDWRDADIASLAGKTVEDSFELNESGYVVVFTDRTVYRFGHRVVHDGDWPEFEVFVGELP